MKNQKRILLVENDAAASSTLRAMLQESNHAVQTCREGAEARQLAARNDFHLLLVSIDVLTEELALLQELRNRRSNMPCVVLTDYGSVPSAVKAIQAGADDYLIKPLQNEAVLEMVSRLTASAVSDAPMVVVDPRSQHLCELARKVAASNATVMISGESGTGKEVYAQFIHQHSPRAAQPFVAINCAAIPETMLESILFGYEKGSFTGATAARAGKFEQANGGTLLLDEISEMDLGLQAKLLRVIQEKEVERLGGTRTIPLDVRIIATTNRNLKLEVQAGKFREDLFYRLNVFPLQLLPLRERRGDIVPLAQRFIENLQGGEGLSLSLEACAVLQQHHWQGNVRELENVIQRALILRSGTLIDADALSFEEMAAPAADAALPAAAPGLETDLKTREKEIIIDAVTRNSRKDAAEKLGISPRTLRYKLAQFRKEGIAVPA